MKKTRIRNTIRQRKGLSSKGQENLYGYLFILPTLIGLFVFRLGPALSTFVFSFFKYDIVTSPIFVGFSNYIKLTKDPLYLRSLVNTLYYVGVSLPLRVFIALLLASLLNRKVRFMGLFRTMYYAPSVSAGVAVALLWMWIYEPTYGLMNHVLGFFGIKELTWLGSPTWAMPALIIMSLWQIGIPMVIFLAGLQSVPPELYEAAEIDGTTFIQRWVHITIPMISPMIFFVVVINVIESFQVFTPAYVMTGGGPISSTLMYVLYLYQRGFDWLQMGYGATLAWVLFIFLLGVTGLQFRMNKWVHHA